MIPYFTKATRIKIKQKKRHRLFDGVFKLIFFKFSVCSSISIALSNFSSIIIPQKNDPTWYALLRGVSGSVVLIIYDSKQYVKNRTGTVPWSAKVN